MTTLSPLQIFDSLVRGASSLGLGDLPALESCYTLDHDRITPSSQLQPSVASINCVSGRPAVSCLCLYSTETVSICSMWCAPKNVVMSCQVFKTVMRIREWILRSRWSKWRSHRSLGECGELVLAPLAKWWRTLRQLAHIGRFAQFDLTKHSFQRNISICGHCLILVIFGVIF